MITDEDETMIPMKEVTANPMAGGPSQHHVAAEKYCRDLKEKVYASGVLTNREELRP